VGAKKRRQGFNRLADTRYGRLLYNRHDEYVGRSLRLYGEYQENEIALFRELIEPGQLVIDVGANIGAHTVWMARQVGNTGRVVAFEPQRLIYQTLCANIALNSLTNVDAHCIALGANYGEAQLPELNPEAENNFGGLGIKGHSYGETIGVIPLDGANIRRPSFMKIDVEGCEHDVLMGARRTIEEYQPLLYVEYDREAERKLVGNYILKQLGYLAFPHFPPLFHPDNFAGNDEDVWPNIASMNLLCVPPSRIKDLAPVIERFCHSGLRLELDEPADLTPQTVT